MMNGSVNQQLTDCTVGSRIWFSEEKRPYRVRVRSDRFLVCTKPFNAKRTMLYTIVDLDNRIRGSESLVFGFGAETDEQCEEMLARLTGKSEVKTDCFENSCTTEISYRNRIPLRVLRVKFPK